MMDAGVERHIESIPHLAKLTPEVLGRALDGFVLPLPDLVWLTQAVRGALYAARPSDAERPDRQPNRKTRDELNRIAMRLAVLWQDMADPDVESAILDFAHRNGEPFGSSEDYRLLQEAQTRLEWLGVFLRRAGMTLDVQRRGWVLRAEKDLHILRARALVHVYREAFGVEPSAHSRPTKFPLPWPDFYQRVMGAAFGQPRPRDLMPMLAEALSDTLTIEGKFWPDKPCD